MKLLFAVSLFNEDVPRRYWRKGVREGLMYIYGDGVKFKKVFCPA